jgi:hypothetical protein
MHLVGTVKRIWLCAPEREQKNNRGCWLGLAVMLNYSNKNIFFPIFEVSTYPLIVRLIFSFLNSKPKLDFFSWIGSLSTRRSQTFQKILIKKLQKSILKPLPKLCNIVKDNRVIPRQLDQAMSPMFTDLSDYFL